MDRPPNFLWTRALVAATALLVGCGKAPSQPRRVASSKTAAHRATPTAEPRWLSPDEDAIPLREQAAPFATRSEACSTTLTAGKSPPALPTIELGPASTSLAPATAPVSSQPPGAARGSELEGPLLFQPGSTAAALRAKESNGSPAPRQTLAAKGPPLAVSPSVLSTAQRPSTAVRPATPSSSPAENSELSLVNQQAAELVRQGFQLAERGATYSARAQFNRALWMVAEALDAQQGVDSHTRSLSAGLTAIREAGDFAVRQHRSDEGVDVAHVVSGHRTPTLKEGRAAGVNSLRAQQIYFSFAQEQLTVAAGRQRAASQALYGVGRLAAVAEGENADRHLGDVGVAVVCFQAALVTDQRNFRAANELGVLLANHGRLPAAAEAFEHCARISPQPVVWRNLAAVYAQLGKKELAESAMAKANAAPPTNNSPVDVQWLEPSKFAETVTQDSLSAPIAPKAAAAPAPAARAPGRPSTAAQRPSVKSLFTR